MLATSILGASFLVASHEDTKREVGLARSAFRFLRDPLDL